MQTLGAAVFVALGQTVFTNRLVSNIKSYNVLVNSLGALSGGATSIATLVKPEYLDLLRTAYNASITEVCYPARFLTDSSSEVHCICQNC
jgi:hypothetical protein